MKLILFFFFLVLMMTEISCAQTPTPPVVEPGVSQTLAKWRAAHYSDVRYKLSLTLEKQAPLMRGEIEIRVKLTEEGAQNDLLLDWRTTQFQSDKDKPYANVTAVNDATEILASEPNEHIRIPKALLKAGENLIRIQFTSPIKTSGAAVTRYVDKEDGAEYIYSLFVPSDASTAFPVFDQPDLKARFQLTLKVPNDWKVVSNTLPKEIQNLPISHSEDAKNKLSETAFEETKPISTYVFAFAAGDFAEVSEAAIVTGNLTVESSTPSKNEPSANPKIYVRKSQVEKFKAHSAEVFRLNREGVKYLESYFDYKFPFPKYDLVLIPEFPFGGMEHAGATFLREASIIFPSEPTKNDFISRANLIFHEAAHQWFGDTVTMKWFDDLWLKEGFAEFMAYKTLAQVMPEYNAWKAFYERNKPLAYLTDSTKGTTPIYQEIPNLSAAKSAYGNIVYRKAPSFLRQAEFYLGEDKFQTAVRAFLKKHEYANAEWTDLVREFETATRPIIISSITPNPRYPFDIQKWADTWIKKPGMPIIRIYPSMDNGEHRIFLFKEKTDEAYRIQYTPTSSLGDDPDWSQKILFLDIRNNGSEQKKSIYYGILNPSKATKINEPDKVSQVPLKRRDQNESSPVSTMLFPNYQDYGYGIFLLDEKSREYVLKSIQTEKDDFLRSMMWGALWDSVREAELNPRDYVELAIKNIAVEKDESTINAILGRVGTALNYYLSETPAVTGGSNGAQKSTSRKSNPPATAGVSDLIARLEKVLEERISNAETPGQRITFYRAYLNLASSARAAQNLKDILAGKSKLAVFQLRTKDKFDLLTRLLILGDKDAPQLLAALEKTETSDDAKRYAYAARAGIATPDSKAKYFKDFMTNREVSESWIEAALSPFNSSRHADLTLPYLETALAELPALKRNRKIFFVNGWLGAFLGGQKSAEALSIVNKFLADNQNLDRDLRLKILENVDGLERAVKIREKFGK